jgi:hypothetical protein
VRELDAGLEAEQLCAKMCETAAADIGAGKPILFRQRNQLLQVFASSAGGTRSTSDTVVRVVTPMKSLIVS